MYQLDNNKSIYLAVAILTSVPWDDPTGSCFEKS